MSSFYGNISSRADDKGRVIVPAMYRRNIPEENGKLSLILTKEDNCNCLALYPKQYWEEVLDVLFASYPENRQEWTADQKRTLNKFIKDAQLVDLDSQGRILIDKQKLPVVGNGKNLVFSGMVKYFQLWDADEYQRFLDGTDADDTKPDDNNA